MNVSKIKPPALKPGDRIGIVAPASNVNREQLEAGAQRLRQAGYEPVYDGGIFEQDLYFAGSVERRARELHEMFERDDIKAIVCARGGYGANYLLSHLDMGLIRRHPKLLIGYSDVTCLLTYIQDSTGLVTFHGPMAAKDFAHLDDVDQYSWSAAVSGTAAWDVGGFESLAPGAGEGELYGGCLSILVASLGTSFEAKTEGKLLFVEDIAAKPYQIDRMLMQMKLAGKFDGVRGIIFGEMLDCVQSPNQPYTLQDVVLRVLQDLNMPIAYGLRSGHVSRENITLPFGVRARLTSAHDGARLEIMEAAVTA